MSNRSTVPSALVKYGTVFMQTTAQVIKCPPWLSLNNPNSDCTPLECSNIFPSERFSPRHPYDGKLYPSISTLLGCTDEMEKLFRWQYGIVAGITHTGFIRMMKERMNSGKAFHKTIENLLKELKENGQIGQTDSQILDEKDVKKYKIQPYIECLLPFLRTLKSEDIICLEEKTLHHQLCYNGRYDAILRIDGIPTLVDWKTINALSDKSMKGTIMRPGDLYNNPVQIAAYVAAVNSNSDGEFVKTCGDELIKQGAVILAFETGQEYQMAQLDADELTKHFDEFKKRVNQFYWKLKNHKPDRRTGIISFVYNPNLNNLVSEQDQPTIP
uniref:PD-(D/E)XK endonuclease-like domain-containing protein n=1 Tax=Acrobeloides nanus TaxID=290746 RepID=A0A914CEA8_9BILA